MTFSKKLELVKKLESMVAFQKDCLDSGSWDDYDKAESEIKKLEDKIVYSENYKEQAE